MEITKVQLADSQPDTTTTTTTCQENYVSCGEPAYCTDFACCQNNQLKCYSYNDNHMPISAYCKDDNGCGCNMMKCDTYDPTTCQPIEGSKVCMHTCCGCGEMECL